MSDVDQYATTARIRALSHEDAEVLEEQIEQRRVRRIRSARREVAGYFGLLALGVLAVLGLWKIVELIAGNLIKPAP